ncbi:unknown [Prevotella sp. CAG:1092]|nr:unknown [Prevotella sp. CAG:1092]
MCYFKIIINSKSECTKAVEVLLPTCLVPDAIKKKLIQHFTFLTPNRYDSRLGRMLELSMVAFCPCQIPTIFLQHLQNIFDFVFFHIIECFDHVGKGMNNNTSKQILCVKSIKSNTIFKREFDE